MRFGRNSWNYHWLRKMKTKLECKYCLKKVLDLKRHLRTCSLTPIVLGGSPLTPQQDADYVAKLRALDQRFKTAGRNKA